MNKCIKTIHSWLFSPICLLCGAPGMKQWDLCEPCYHSLPSNNAACFSCGIPFASESNHQAVCGHCLQFPPPYERCVAGWRYEPPMDFFVRRLKFNKDLAYARLMAQLLADRLVKIYCDQTHKPEVIFPVPLHSKRLRERGFNQAAEIARVISRKLSIPMDITSCVRTKMTLAQAELHAHQRGKNVKNAFTYVPSGPYRHVAIVDDVMTTGHTVTELAKTIQKTSDTRIQVWICARATYR